MKASSTSVTSAIKGVRSLEPQFEWQQLTDREQALLQKVSQNLTLLADLCRSDVLLYVLSSDQTVALVVGEAKPHSVPPIHQEPLLGTEVDRSQDPVLFRCLARGWPIQGIATASTRGAPIVQSTWPIRVEQRTFAILAVQTNFLEHERQRRKSVVYRNAVAQVRRMVIQGQLEGTDNLSRLGEHDGSLVVDSGGLILYISSIAENIYRKLGYSQSLLGRRIEEMRTDESVFFKAVETGASVEETVLEGEYTLIKRAIPLVAPIRPTWLGRQWMTRLRQTPREIDGVMMVVQDVTEERQKEQELKIKSAMIQEIHHRVKNNLQTIAALLRLQARRTGTAEVADILQQTINRILSIAVVHEFLSYDESSIINLHEVVQRIVNEGTQSILDPIKHIRFVLEGQDVYLPAQQATSCALIINELLQNAVEHGFANKCDGLIRISLKGAGDEYRLEIVDDGEGLRPGFDAARDGSLGLQIVRTLVREDLRGRFHLLEDKGVHAIVTFPKQTLDGRYRPPAVTPDRARPTNPVVTGEEDKAHAAN